MKTIFILLISILAINSFSQSNQGDWHYIMSTREVQSIQEDSINIYFGTFGGLIIHNKLNKNLSYFCRDNSNIPFHDIYSLFVDNNSIIYIGGSQGFAMYDGQSWSYFNSKNSNLIDGRVDKIVGDNNGNIYLLISNSYIQKFNGSTFNSNYEAFESTIGNIGIDQNNKLWYSVPFTLVMYIHNTNTSFSSMDYTNPFDLPDGLCTDFEISPQGQLWFSIADLIQNGSGAVLYYDNQTIHNITDSSYVLKNVLDISFKKNGRALLATKDLGILEYNNGNYKVLDKNLLGIDTNEITKIHVDQNNLIWFVCSKGIYHMDSNYQNISRLSPPRYDLLNNAVKNFMISSDASKYFVYQTGHYNDIECTVMNPTDTFTFNDYGVPSNFNYVEDSNNAIWYPIHKGVAQLKDSTINMFTAPYPLLYYSSEVHDLAIDTNGLIYLATFEGLLTFDGSSWNKVQSYPGTNNYFYALAIDKKGEIYMSTYQDGIVSYYNGNWKVYNKAVGEAIKIIKCDNNNNVWFVTQNKKLYIYKQSSWQVINPINNPLSLFSHIFDIGFDNQNKLYVTGSEGGIASFDGSAWDTINRNNSYLNYDYSGSIRFDSNGNIYFGQTGIVIYNPNGVILNNNIKPIVSNNNVNIYPNPTSNNIYIASEEEIKKVSIIDLNGRTHFLKEYEGKLGIQLNIQEFNAGVYIVIIYTDKKVLSKKIIVNQ